MSRIGRLSRRPLPFPRGFPAELSTTGLNGIKLARADGRPLRVCGTVGLDVIGPEQTFVVAAVAAARLPGQTFEIISDYEGPISGMEGNFSMLERSRASTCRRLKGRCLPSHFQKVTNR